MKKNKRRVVRRVGDVIAIPLGGGTYGYGRVLRDPLVGFYRLRTEHIATIVDVVEQPIEFAVFVMNSPIVDGQWPVIGHKDIEPELLHEPVFFKKDPISQRYTIYRDSTGEEMPASKEDCIGLERAAVWEPAHIVDRLVDLFEDRPNRWVKSLQP